MLHFYPLRDEKDRLAGVLGVVSPAPPPMRAAEVSPARRLHAELSALRMALRARFGPTSLVARGQAMRRICAQVELAQNSQSPVLFVGAPGTGKEHLARVIHFGSPTKAGWFVPLDCRRLGPDEIERVWNRLLESVRVSPGAAPSTGLQPGTVFLADVEFLPRDVQERVVGIFSSAAGKP